MWIPPADITIWISPVDTSWGYLEHVNLWVIFRSTTEKVSLAFYFWFPVFLCRSFFFISVYFIHVFAGINMLNHDAESLGNTPKVFDIIFPDILDKKHDYHIGYPDRSPCNHSQCWSAASLISRVLYFIVIFTRGNLNEFMRLKINDEIWNDLKNFELSWSEMSWKKFEMTWRSDSDEYDYKWVKLILVYYMTSWYLPPNGSIFLTLSINMLNYDATVWVIYCSFFPDHLRE